MPTAPTTETIQVRIRTIRQVAPVPADGTHVTLSAHDAGGVGAGAVDVGRRHVYAMTRHAASATGPWVVEATLAS